MGNFATYVIREREWAHFGHLIVFEIRRAFNIFDLESFSEVTHMKPHGFFHLIELGALVQSQYSFSIVRLRFFVICSHQTSAKSSQVILTVKFI